MRHWMEEEFDRTGLPRVSLAAYLGLDASLISRIIRGERPMHPEENDLARAFFSIVTKTPKKKDVSAIEHLKISKRREAAAFELAHWLLNKNLIASDSRLRSLLVEVANKAISLTADQIVALCRFLPIDLEKLVDAQKVVPAWDADDARVAELQTNSDIIRDLTKEAAVWVGHGTPYQFYRSTAKRSPKALGESIQSVVLESLSDAGRFRSHADSIHHCEPFVVTTDRFAPRFEQGQTIFLEHHAQEPRKGDYVAVIKPTRDEKRPNAVLGRLIFITSESISVMGPRNTQLDIPLGRDTRIQRIAFCKF